MTRFGWMGGVLWSERSTRSVAMIWRRYSVVSNGHESKCKRNSETPISPPDLVTRDTATHLVPGSSGKIPLGEAATLLRSLPLRIGKGDTLLLGLGHTSDPAKIERAYNDRKGFSRRFILNGLKHAGRVMGDESIFAPEKWAYVGRYDAQERKFTFIALEHNSWYTEVRNPFYPVKSGINRSYRHYYTCSLNVRVLAQSRHL